MRAARASGFSLIELLVVVAIVAIVASLAFPSFQDTLRSNRVNTAHNELIGSLSLARVEGLRSPGGAVLCSSSNGTTCGGGWNDGWIVWIDLNGNNSREAEERVLRHVQARSGVNITATSPGGAAFANTIKFDNRGRVGVNTRQLTVQPDTCPSGRDLVRRINVGLTGQARTTRENCT